MSNLTGIRSLAITTLLLVVSKFDYLKTNTSGASFYIPCKLKTALIKDENWPPMKGGIVSLIPQRAEVLAIRFIP